jgi:hypothetical protein
LILRKKEQNEWSSKIDHARELDFQVKIGGRKVQTA